MPQGSSSTTPDASTSVSAMTRRLRARRFRGALSHPEDVAPPEVEVLGVPLARTDYDRTMDWMDAMVAAGEQGYVCVAATHTVMAYQEDAGLREAVRSSSLTVPDGQP